MTPRKQDLKALRNLIERAHTIVSTTPMPEGRSEAATALLSAAVRLADELLIIKPAAVLGKKGGSETAKRGPEYYAQIAGMRKTRAGGRPRKETA